MGHQGRTGTGRFHKTGIRLPISKGETPVIPVGTPHISPEIALTGVMSVTHVIGQDILEPNVHYSGEIIFKGDTVPEVGHSKGEWETKCSQAKRA